MLRRMTTLDTLAPTWGGHELRYAHFGDQRLRTRAIALLLHLAAQPEGALPAALGNPHALKAAYRFFANAGVTPTAIRAAHRDRTLDRIRPLERLLLVQDTTELDYTAHPATTGLGPLACPTHQGLLVHTTLALTAAGAPCGVLDQQVWTRDPAEHGKAAQRRQRPAEAKESRRWGEALHASHQHLSPALETITIADREADIYALFAAPRPPRAHLLIRGTHNRAVTAADEADAHYLWDAVRRAVPFPTPLVVAVPRGHAGEARTATLTVRGTTVALHAPHGGPARVPAVRLLLVEEETPPPGVTPICWLLLTTLPVTTFDEAAQCVRWYTLRWLIERYHYVLKSGCTLEKLQLEAAGPLQRAVALNSIVAWRLLHLTYLARLAPAQPATACFTREELAVACAAVERRALALAETPPLMVATRWVARLGGFQGRPSDGPPGPKTLWRGLRRLDALVEGTRLALLLYPPSGKPGLVGDA